MPSISSAAESVRELITSLQPEGISPEFSLPKALGYSTVMLKLEELGLVKPASTTPRTKTSSDKGTGLAKVHHDKVGVKNLQN